MSTNIDLEPEWKSRLAAQFTQEYMLQLKQFLLQQKAQGKTIYPKGAEIFNAFNTTAFDQVKVVIIGQDPYHGPGQAHGLCFSVQPHVAIPPSLQNIYKELATDLGLTPPNHGHLQAWAKQGVLLLNSVLTVQAGMAGSHRKQGWEIFTDAAIAQLNQEREHLVFMLWGSYAKAKGANIDRNKHLVLEAPHPSPLSAHRGFLGCKHFSQANYYLQQHNQTPINWQLDNI